MSTTDECKPASSGEAVAELILEGSTPLANFSDAFTELSGAKLATCSQGGAESGETGGGSTIKLTGGGELSASSEGAEIGKPPTGTSLATSLSGESKEGETLTVLEGSKVKDKATLSGEKASKATGTVAYKVYSESTCKTLVTSAGEVTVTSGSVPTSSEEELAGGETYYWQAQYSGDSENAASTSPCTEVLNVKAKTSLSANLADGAEETEEGEELTVLEDTKVTDKATLSGTNSSSAGGKVAYKIYSDEECKELVKGAGEVTVSSGSVPASEEEALESPDPTTGKPPTQAMPSTKNPKASVDSRSSSPYGYGSLKNLGVRKSSSIPLCPPKRCLPPQLPSVVLNSKHSPSEDHR